MNAPFELTGRLPEGTLLLEASAGTGKTYALASLAVRFIAETDTRLENLLLITFSRMATAELRDRVLARLTEAVSALAAAVEGIDGAQPHQARPDTVLAHLCAGTHEQLAVRHARLVRAVADFDGAAIATTHEFCRRMLFGLGVLVDHDPDPRFVSDPRPLAREVAADLYLSRFADAPQPPFPYRSDFGRRGPAAREFVAKVAVEPAAVIVPEGMQGPGAARVAFAHDAVAEIERRKLRQRVFTYDDQLVRLRDALRDPLTGPAAVDRLAAHFPIVMVDEFQDTDPIQWEILRAAFHGRSRLILIGDPKQAIYGFRGADIGTYQQAAAAADARAALLVNYRSDAPLVAALDQLFDSAQVGEDIGVPSVTAARAERRVHGRPPLTSPFRVRGIPPTSHPLDPWRATDAIIDDLTTEVATLLATDTAIDTDDGPRPVAPTDIAVLTRTNRTAGSVAKALQSAGIAASVSATTSIFATAAAHQWLRLLKCLAEPRPAVVRDAALTVFVGRTARDLALASDTESSSLWERIQQWSTIWLHHGSAALWQTILATPHVVEHIVSLQDGRRMLADLWQVSQELVVAEAAGSKGPGLADWLSAQVDDPGEQAAQQALRDDDAVHVLTIHKAKGLEFPFVLLPDLGMRYLGFEKNPDRTLVFHNAEGVRCIDIGGGTAPGRRSREAASQEEADAESLRDLYVAVTRAQLGVVAWWAPTRNTPASPLHRMLARPAGTSRPDAHYGLDALTLRPDRPDITFERMSIEAPRTRPSVRRRSVSSAPVARVFDRPIDRTWRRTSYSGLTAAAHEMSFAEVPGDDEPSEPIGADRLAVGSGPAHSVSAPTESVSPYTDLPRGAEFGTLVHSALEEIDFAAVDLPAEIAAATQRWVARSALPVTAPSLGSALHATITAPLGDLAGGRRLADFRRADRLNELAFDLPLATAGSATLGMIADMLAEHLPPGDPLAAYPELLTHLDPTTPALRGILTGSIDAVLRLSPENRFVVVDYKTNRLGGPEQLLEDYDPTALAQAMMDNHYPLQAILYCVALHRFLRWRLPGYSPDRHLGGVGYLFVRGMSGAARTGVFEWHPAPALISDLSDALAGAGAPTGAAPDDGPSNEPGGHG